MKNILFITIIILLLASCNGNQKFNHSLNKLYPDLAKGKSVLLSELAEDLRYIKLETIGNHMVGNVDKVEFYNKKIFILDTKGAKALFVFDTIGRFINKLSNHGSGTQQFQEPVDFTINEATNRVCLYCSKLHKILEFDMMGNFQEEWFPDLSFSQFKWIGDENFIAFIRNKYNYRNSEGLLSYNLIKFNRNGDILLKEFPNGARLNEGKLSFSFGKNLSGSHREPYFYNTFCDTIYHITEQGARPSWIIDFASNTIPKNKKEDVVKLLQDLNLGKYSCYSSFFITEKYAHLTYLENILPGYLIYDRSSSKILSVSEIINDIDDGILHPPDHMMNDCLVIANYPEELLTDSEGKSIDGPLNLKGVEEAVNMYDNPILMLIKINQNLINQ